MKIKEIYIDAFGILKSQLLRPDSGLSCYVLGNGRGKTTLTYFIKAMLYGLDDSRRSLPDNERLRFIPWDRDRACGHMTIEYRGTVLRIERSFGKRAADDTLEVYDETTGRKTDELGEIPGITVLGIDKDGYEKTLFISERLLRQDSSNDSLTSKLSNEYGTVYAIDEYKRAHSILESAKKSIQRRGGGELTECKEALSRLQAKEAELRPCEDEYLSLRGELARTEEKIKHAPGGDAYEKGKRNSSVKSRGKGDILCTALLVSILLSAVAAATTYGTSLSYVTPIAAALALVLAFTLALVSSRHRTRRENTDEVGIDDSEAQKVILLERERSSLVFRREALHSSLTELRALTEEIDAKRAKISALEEELFAIEATEALLSQAKDSIVGKYLDGTRAAFSNYLKELGESHELTLDNDFCIRRRDTGGTRELNAYSRGRRELYSFALRLAIIDSLWSDIKPTVIIDDAFSSYDDESLTLATRLMLRLSRERQIIYLTPSHSRAHGLSGRG